MPRFKFTKDFDYKPTMQSTIGYKAGYEGLITTAAAQAAEKAGAGKAEKDAPAKADKPAKANG